MNFEKAINTQDGIPRGVALNIELTGDGNVPERIQLLPAGNQIIGRDGRKWLNDRPDNLLAAFSADGRDLPIDWEHASEIKAPNGEQAPAAGWIKALELQNGELWARVEWTPSAVGHIRNREYRYISPVFVYEKETRRINRITSAGLTNQPNLFVAALNQETKKTKEEIMELAQLLAALGLPATATFAEALNRIGAINQEHATALNRAENPPLDKFVPRADYDKALERATNAETSLKKKEDDALETAINTEIDAALKAGKITPATADYHKAQCRTEGGLERFKVFAAAAPVVGENTDLDNQDHNKDKKEIDEVQRAVNRQMGIDDETFKKYNKAS
jgi:phage I-like protein